MASKWLNAPSTRPDRALDIVRIVVALLLAVHSIYRVIAGDVAGFGEYLGSIHFPAGVALAWFITIYTFGCSIALVLRRWVIPACIGHMIILITGIFLDHIHSGWFVVGGGTNGMEYSVLLIACLFAVAWSHWPRLE